jgi:hypothetical protein
MKKSELIALLEGVKGNPDIVVWNLHCDDWNPVRVVDEMLLTKEPLQKYLRAVEFERRRDTNDWKYKLKPEEIKEAERAYNQLEYEYDHLVSEEEIKEGVYKAKRVLCIIPAKRHRERYDRLSKIEY